jgi:hypothetical protein
MSAAAGVLMACVMAVGFAEAAAQIKVNWADPELKAFAAERETAAANGLLPEAESPLASLAVPVLAFERPPEAVTRNMRAGPEAEPERVEHFDADNPVWYQIVEDYGDVSVSVSADLRVQHTFGADFPVYAAPAAPGAGVDGGEDAPQVSVMDDKAEEGLEGYIAEYTITRFGVPYTVTVECSAAAKAQCADEAQLAKDSALLKLIGGVEPKTP